MLLANRNADPRANIRVTNNSPNSLRQIGAGPYGAATGPERVVR